MNGWGMVADGWPEGSHWMAAAPAAAWIALIGLALASYAVRCVGRGPYRDAEQEARGGSALLQVRLRCFFAWAISPLVSFLVRCGISPTGITLSSVGFSVLAGLLAAVGWLGLAGSACLVSGLCDFLDGRVARLTGRTSSSGAALDSILDRYSDAAVLVGLGWYYRDSWRLLAVLLLLTGSLFVPYVRARGEGLGIDTKVGLMQRPERVVLLSAALIFGPVIDLLMGWRTPGVFLISVICVLAVLTHLTAVARIVHVTRRLNERDRDTEANSMVEGNTEEPSDDPE